ncbi:hypothetical protein FJTKL_06295 [Diaporthe vaccinii]|uniref:AB hydrolase-1 domain-containing protein n=1 Tax=Diaporthe vaccinii TaxID=105482 RepID=A0ABR4DQM9_9PEZI
MTMAAVSSGSTADSPSSRAAEYLAQDRFHRRFTLPATSDHGELQVSYADVGRTPRQGEDGTRYPTVLFIPGMFASRYLSVWMHAIAETLGVRVLIVDRPGMGHSTDVPLKQRVTVWIEVVPPLLAHLQIDHVALASHSSGTIYLLNTLVRCRGILDPNRPVVALVAPWVDPAHSHVTSMQMAKNLPTSVFGVWHHMPKIVSAGGAVFDKISKLLPSSSGVNAAETPPLERNRQKIERDYGLPVELQKELQTLTLKAIFSENMVGADSEALCCLRKGPAGLWAECDDYALFVKKLAELERSRRAAEGDGNGERLRVNAYFAETDSMIGKRGQSYMEDCWKGNGGGEFQDVLNFTTMTVKETDHDSVVQSVEVLNQIFLDVGGATLSSL